MASQSSRVMWSYASRTRYSQTPNLCVEGFQITKICGNSTRIMSEIAVKKLPAPTSNEEVTCTKDRWIDALRVGNQTQLTLQFS